MSTRKITIISSKTQSQYVIPASAAQTLGELKNEMDEMGIEYEDMSFFEGHARVELKDNASILPTNIPYKGQVVNDLIFMLTNSEKKIKSGAMTRAEAYAGIKKHNLQQKCKELYNKNFTQCSTDSLIALIKQAIEAAPQSIAEEEIHSTQPVDKYKEALLNIAQLLRECSIIENDTTKESVVMEDDKPVENKAVEAKKMSQKEIDDMFDFI